MPFRPYVSRSTRIINVIRKNSRQLFLNHPECVLYTCTFGVVGLGIAFNKMYKYGLWEGSIFNFFF